MEEAEVPAAPHRTGTGPFLQFNEGCITVLCTEAGDGTTAFDHPQPQDTLVECDGTAEVRDLEAHRAQPGGGG